MPKRKIDHNQDSEHVENNKAIKKNKVNSSKTMTPKIIVEHCKSW